MVDAYDSNEVVEKWTFTCRDCDHSYDNRFEVTQHRNTDGSVNEFACDSKSGCCQGFDTEQELDDHKAKAKHGV